MLWTSRGGRHAKSGWAQPAHPAAECSRDRVSGGARPRPGLEAEIRRLAYRRCGRVWTEAMPWARFTRGFDDVAFHVNSRGSVNGRSRLEERGDEVVDSTAGPGGADRIDVVARLDDLPVADAHDEDARHLGHPA